MCIAGCTPREQQGEEAKKQPETPCNKTTEPCPLDLQKKLKDCDSGETIFNNAKKANDGKDPIVKVDTTKSGFGAETDKSTGTITISKDSDPCTAVQKLSMELGNLARKKELAKLDQDRASCKISRDDYIRGKEQLEYGSVSDALKAFDSCKDKWGCSGQSSRYEWARGAKDFNDYFDNYLSTKHKEYHGKVWDRSCKK